MNNLHIVLKGIPPSANQFNGRENHWAYREAKRRWTNAVYLLCQASHDKPKLPLNRALVIIDYYFPDRRRRDEDNFSGKMLLDGLVKARVIVDDNMWVISKLICPHVDRKRPRTEIIVVSLEDLELSDGRPGRKKRKWNTF